MSHITSDFGTETTVGHLTGVLDSTYYWDEKDANPIRDILDLQTVFEDQDGYNYNMTDVYMRYRDLHLLSTFCTEIGADWVRDPLGGFQASNVAGITFHGLKNVSGFQPQQVTDTLWHLTGITQQDKLIKVSPRNSLKQLICLSTHIWMMQRTISTIKCSTHVEL